MELHIENESEIVVCVRSMAKSFCVIAIITYKLKLLLVVLCLFAVLSSVYAMLCSIYVISSNFILFYPLSQSKCSLFLLFHSVRFHKTGSLYWSIHSDTMGDTFFVSIFSRALCFRIWIAIETIMHRSICQNYHFISFEAFIQLESMCKAKILFLLLNHTYEQKPFHQNEYSVTKTISRPNSKAWQVPMLSH